MPRHVLKRSQNAKRNIAFGLLHKSVSLTIPFLTRTIIIRVMGAQYLGLDGLFASILQVLNLTELGFGSAIVFSMYEPIANKDNVKLRALLRLYKHIYGVVGTIILLGGSALIPFIPRLIKGTWPADINIYVLYILYLLNTVISYFLFGYKNSLLNAYQRTDFLSKVHLITVVICNILQIAVIVFTRNYYLFVVITILTTIITNLMVAVITKREFPDLYCEGDISDEEKQTIKIKVKGLMINKLCQTSRNAFDSIFISSFIGLVDTAIYNNYFYILTAISGVLNIVGSSIMAGVGNSIVTDSQEKNHMDMQRINFVYMWIAGWCTVCLLCLYQPFLSLFFGKDMLFPTYIMIMFCIYFYILKMGDIRAVYSEAKGLWWENRYRSMIEALLNISLNYTLGKQFGVAGIVLATIVSLFFVNFLWGSTIIYKHYFTRISMSLYYGPHLLYAVLTTLICVITFILCGLIAVNGIVGLFLKALICITIPNAILYFCHKNSSIYRETFDWLSERMPIKKL